MVWEPSNQNGGFSVSQPWLPVSSAHLARSAAAQEADPGAPLHHYRRAIGFRRVHSALTQGAHEALKADGDVLSFMRTDASERIFCAFNLSETPSTIDMPAGKWQAIGAELGVTGASEDGKLHLGPWQACFALETSGKRGN
jgi:alpha-glucosidase